MENPSLDQDLQTCLSTKAARNLSTTTKSRPQMEGISPRWLLRVLPWVDVSGGVFRVNRRRSFAIGDGLLTFTTAGSRFRVIPQELVELPIFHGFEDEAVLESIADRFVQHEVQPGDVLVEEGRPADRIVLVAYGKLEKIGVGKYGDPTTLGLLAEGDYLAYGEGSQWSFTAKAVTTGTVLTLERAVLEQISAQSESLTTHMKSIAALGKVSQDKHGQAAINVSAGHVGEPSISSTFVDYELRPREYELSVAQTILRVHTRVTDLFNGPMSQLSEQLRLTIESIRETEERELFNNPHFGLLHNVHPQQRLHTRRGAPTPDDMDALLTRRRRTRFFFAHPRAIAAFGRACNEQGIEPQTLELEGQRVQTWRGVPLLPTDKIPVTDEGVTSILALRPGLEDQGVVGLRPRAIPDEHEPGLNVRFMGIDERAVTSYLVSAYYSIASLIPDAFGVLDNVEVSR